MYRSLFDLAGLAIVAWLLLMLLPTWRVTRWLAETAVFPAFLSALYAIGIMAVLFEMGPGIMRDFGNADGVLALLRTEGLALVAWIHILAFDQVVGLLIYRDNMRHRFVALPVQSVILFLTLMFGPVGFLIYYAARVSNWRSGRVAWGEATTPAAKDGAPSPASLRFADVKARSITSTLLALWNRERLVVGCAMLAFVLAGVCLAAAAVGGSWHVPPEGRLLEALNGSARGRHDRFALDVHRVCVRAASFEHWPGVSRGARDDEWSRRRAVSGAGLSPDSQVIPLL